jgi:hypothetical protein
MKSVTHLCLCVAHIIKTVCNRMTKVQPQACKRRAHVAYFVALLKSDDLKRAQEIYRRLFIILCSHAARDIQGLRGNYVHQHVVR